jgi:glycosyltransferase involved in cell wall biosynthesis
MKIGILTLSLKRGGAERVASLVGTFLSDRHEVHTILFDTSGGFDYPYGGELVDLNLPEPKGRDPLARLKNTLKAVPKLRRLKRELKLDVMLSFLEPANIPNVLSRTPECKTVLAITEDKSYTQLRDVQRWVTDFLIRQLYGKADLIVSASKGAGRTLSEKYGVGMEKIRPIYNPVDLDAIAKMADAPVGKDYETLFDGPVVLSAGRLTLPKGYWHLLRAFRMVKEAVPAAKLVILGDGEQKSYLAGLADELGLSDCVFFPGYQTNPFCFMKRASVFVLSSLWEGFGNVVLESLAAGTPVVATDVRSGPREILAPETDFYRRAVGMELAEYGILVTQLDGKFRPAGKPLIPAEMFLAEGIVKMLTDQALAEGYRRKGPERAWAFRTEALLPIYEQTLWELIRS